MQYGCQTTEQPVKVKVWRPKNSFCNGISIGRKALDKFVKSEENYADTNTKNTPNTTFKTHQVKIVWEKDEITRMDS